MLLSRRSRVAALAAISCCAAASGDTRVVVVRTCAELKDALVLLSLRDDDTGARSGGFAINYEEVETLDCLGKVSVDHVAAAAMSFHVRVSRVAYLRGARRTPSAIKNERAGRYTSTDRKSVV